MTQPLPTFSVVIEWENARFSDPARSRAMLLQLGRQITELSPRLPARPKIILLHDRAGVDAKLVERAVNAAFAEVPAEVIILATEGLDYYEMKNFGASQSDSEIVVFLDCDVIPEDGWLLGLLEPFQSPQASVVSGNTYVSTDGFYNKAFALIWFYALRDDGDRLLAVNFFFANNLAFRRKLFNAYLFPKLPLFRGRCTALSGSLVQRGIPILLQQRSRVSHPAPNGVWHTTVRALCAGHDEVVWARLKGDDAAAGFRASLSRCNRSIRDAAARIFANRGKIGLGLAGAWGALGIAFMYFSVKLGGELLTQFQPRIIRRYFAV